MLIKLVMKRKEKHYINKTFTLSLNLIILLLLN